MRWIAVLALWLVLIPTARAAGPDDQYLDIYNAVLQADGLRQNGQPAAAAAKYLHTQTALQKLKAQYPQWNTEVVNFRLDYLAEQLRALGKALPPANAPPPAPAPPANPEAELTALREQVRSLTAANAESENKLKEALSVQPAAVSPSELAKAREQIVALQKERDLIAVALEQAKSRKPDGTPSPESEKPARQLADVRQALQDLQARAAGQNKADQTDIAQLKDSLADAQKKLAADASELETLKSSRPAQSAANPDAGETEKLKAELAQRTKDLADAEAHVNPDVVALRAQLQQAGQQRDDLQKILAAAPQPQPAANPAGVPAADAQIAQLRARLAVLEAKAVPYTPEELAQLKPIPSAPLAQIPDPPPAAPQPAPAAGETAAPPAQTPAPPPQRKHVAHSSKELPPGAGALMAEALRASMQRDYAVAAAKCQQILRQDENNVYVLAFLANAQYAQGQKAECEITLQRALALDPDDSLSLYLLGRLRYLQNRLDEALDALSRSALYNPTNANTQNYLGCVLADKGLRPAAETALRKALQIDPDYADAHYNLAIIYAAGQHPSPELARWHYKRAVDLGHPKDAEFEKKLALLP